MKTKQITLVIYFFLILFGLKAQTPLPKGFYMSLEELRLKSPSIVDVEFTTQKIKSKRNDVNKNLIKIENKDNKKIHKELKNKAFFYSDGSNLFLNGKKLGASNYFQVELVEDRVYFYEYQGVSPNSYYVASILFGLVGVATVLIIDIIKKPKVLDYEIDLTTNEIGRRGCLEKSIPLELVNSGACNPKTVYESSILLNKPKPKINLEEVESLLNEKFANYLDSINLKSLKIKQLVLCDSSFCCVSLENNTTNYDFNKSFVNFFNEIAEWNPASIGENNVDSWYYWHIKVKKGKFIIVQKD
jgi:hypothetical protein